MPWYTRLIPTRDWWLFWHAHYVNPPYESWRYNIEPGGIDFAPYLWYALATAVIGLFVLSVRYPVEEAKDKDGRLMVNIGAPVIAGLLWPLSWFVLFWSPTVWIAYRFTTGSALLARRFWRDRD